MMTNPFAIFRDRCSTSVVAVILGILLLLPASLGLGGRIIENAFAQFNVPPLPEERDTTTNGGTTSDTTTNGGTTNGGTTSDTTTNGGTTTAPPQGVVNGLTFTVRGFVGSTLPTGGGGNTDTHVVAGRFRISANDSLIHRFVADMSMAPIDGSSINNVTITESAPHRFEMTQTTNGTTATTSPEGSSPPFTSKIMASIYVNNNPVLDDVPMTLSVKGQVLAVQDISIDQSRIVDPGMRDLLGVFNGQSIYGTIPR
jgi:hypothetical protein